MPLFSVLAAGYLAVLQSGYRSLPTPEAVNCKTVACDYVTAKGLGVTDGRGKLRIALSISEGDVATQGFFRPDGQIAAAIGANPAGGVANFVSGDGRANVWTGFYESGRPGIHIRDGKGVMRAQLDLGESGAMLVLRDGAGRTIFENH